MNVCSPTLHVIVSNWPSLDHSYVLVGVWNVFGKGWRLQMLLEPTRRTDSLLNCGWIDYEWDCNIMSTIGSQLTPRLHSVINSSIIRASKWTLILFISMEKMSYSDLKWPLDDGMVPIKSFDWFSKLVFTYIGNRVLR